MSGLSAVVIYHDPSDYPGRFVARRQWVSNRGIEAEATPMMIADELADIHACIPMGMIRFPRQPNDEPQIVETWM